MKKRKDGRYEQKIYIGTVDGIKKYKTVSGKSQKEVKQRAADLKAQMGKGVDITADKTFKKWAEMWLDSREDKLTDENYHTVKSRTELFINRFGKTDVDKITAADVEKVFTDLARQNPYTHAPTAKKTLIGYRGVIVQIFDYCLKSRVLAFNPASYIEIPKTAKKGKRNALTDTQIKKIRETPHECQTVAMIMVYAGLRLGEALALNWNDIDFDRKKITVDKSYNDKEKQIKSPKTEAGIREVPLLTVLEEYLLTLPQDYFLVCSDNGKLITRGSFKCKWKHYCETLGFDFLAHECRHTFITLLYEAGLDELTTASIVGHADISTTREIYTHLREKKKEETFAKIRAIQ